MSPTAAAAIREAPERSFVRVDSLPGTRAAARKAASRAAADRVLVPVRRGLYYRGVPTRYGMTTPRPEDVVREVFGDRGIGPAGFSAARAWGVTTQVPPVLTIAVPYATEPIRGVKQVTRRNLWRRDLTGLEVALLEVLRDPGVLVEAGWSVLVGRVRDAVRDGRVRFDAVSGAASREHNASVRKHFARLCHDLEARR